MFSKNSRMKVKFQDQQLDDYLLETSVLKSKLQSKTDALLIMSKELDKCSMERDKFKILVEQMKFKKPVLHSQNKNTSIYNFTPTNTISSGDMLTKTQDDNNFLKLEVESLRTQLEEATGDIVALRKQLQKKETCPNEPRKELINQSGFNRDYEQLVQELEKFKKKYQQIQLDYRATLDEKEEMICDRDYYKNKVLRLNQQISYILSSRIKSQQADTTDDCNPPKPIVDIDALITENKYLHERITQLQVEKEIIKRTLTKYKSLLDNRTKNESMHYKKGFANVMTQRQVREFLDTESKTGSMKSSASELKSLCLGLFEALNDKSIGLQHQRKTNQILANRITELEKTLESWCNGEKYIPIFPSQMLMEEFLPEANGAKSDSNKINDTIKLPEYLQEDFKKKSGSDEDLNKCQSDDYDTSEDVKSDYNGTRSNYSGTMTKTVLPHELEELVKEALAELKPGS